MFASCREVLCFLCLSLWNSTFGALLRESLNPSWADAPRKDFTEHRGCARGGNSVRNMQQTLRDLKSWGRKYFAEHRGCARGRNSLRNTQEPLRDLNFQGREDFTEHRGCARGRNSVRNMQQPQ